MTNIMRGDIDSRIARQLYNDPGKKGGRKNKKSNIKSILGTREGEQPRDIIQET